MNNNISISKKLAHEGLFLLIVGNPTWSEIINILLPRRVPQKVPDGAVKALMLKKPVMLPYIIDENLFGNETVHVRILEL